MHLPRNAAASLVLVLVLAASAFAADCVDYATAPPDSFVSYSLLPDEFVDGELVGDVLWCARSFYGALVSVDVSDPDAPTTLGVEPVTVMDETYDVAVSGDLAFLTYIQWGGAAGVRIFDITDPADPVDAGDVPAPPGRWASYVAARDSLIYVSFSYYDFGVVDVHDPAAPVLLGTVTIDHPWTIQLVGDHAFVTTDAQPVIIDVSDPTDPRWVATLPTSARATGLDVSGGIAYATSGSGIELFDVSDPLAPVFLGSAAAAGTAISTSLRGDLLYVGVRDLGVELFDVSDPTAPVSVATIATTGLPWTQIRLPDRQGIVAHGVLNLVPLQCAPTTAVAPTPAAPRLTASPNPFNPATRLDFALEADGPVRLDVHDLAGRRVRTLLDGAVLDAGPHGIRWDGRDDAGRALPSGVYVFRLESGGRVAAHRAVLAR